MLVTLALKKLILIIFLKMKPKEKLQLLARLIELSVQLGEDIRPIIGKPLSYFDWDKVAMNVSKKEIEYEQM